MKIFEVIKILSFLIFGLELGLVSSSKSESSKTRPNIIFIMADDLGWNDVGFHGNDAISTPNIDALAYSGVILNNYYVQPVCTPSRGAFLSGMYPIHTGLQHFVILAATPYGLPLNCPIFPHYLKKLGYSTRIVGKWHLGYFRKEYTPAFRDFDSHYGYWNGAIDYYNYTYAYEEDGLSGHDFRRNLKVEYPEIGTYATDLFADESVNIINGHDTSKPLFLYVSHLAPHVGNPGARFQAPEEVIKMFSHIEDENKRIYAAMIWKLDESVGKLVKALEDNDMLSNSIIVFTTDNGGAAGFHEGVASNWPLRGTKGTLWEAGIRGSALVWSSLLKNPGRVSTEMIHMTDWLPTLYHAAGGKVSDLPKLDGKNVWKSIEGNSFSPRDEFLVNINPNYNEAGIRFGDWKLLYNPYDRELFGPTLNSWFGSSERDSPTDKNPTTKASYIENIEDSLAGGIVQKLMPDIFENIPKIRRNAKVTCEEVPEDATATCDDPSNPCLFNIASDPCEYYDVSKSFPEVVELLLKQLRIYNTTAVPPGNKPKDPRANPIFWNNTWTNWFDYLDEDNDI